jgi:hypothetical protein
MMLVHCQVVCELRVIPNILPVYSVASSQIITGDDQVGRHKE